MIANFLPLLKTFFSNRLWIEYFVPIFILCLIATVPCLIRYFISMGGR